MQLTISCCAFHILRWRETLLMNECPTDSEYACMQNYYSFRALVFYTILPAVPCSAYKIRIRIGSFCQEIILQIFLLRGEQQ